MQFSFIQVQLNPFTMTNEVVFIPQNELPEVNKLEISYPSSGKETPVIPLPVEKRLPPAEKEFPISKWTMPPEPQGYIKGNDNDCL